MKERISIAEAALATFEHCLREDLHERPHRDVAILRFMYTFEATAKAAQHFHEEVGGLKLVGPKSLVRASFQAGLLDEAEAASALLMVDDRNVVVHTYNERLAVELALRLPGHATLLSSWLNRLRSRV